MLCMNKALAEMTMDPRLKTNLQNALQQLATHMINQEPDQESGDGMLNRILKTESTLP